MKPISDPRSEDQVESPRRRAVLFWLTVFGAPVAAASLVIGAAALARDYYDVTSDDQSGLFAFRTAPAASSPPARPGPKPTRSKPVTVELPAAGSGGAHQPFRPGPAPAAGNPASTPDGVPSASPSPSPSRSPELQVYPPVDAGPGDSGSGTYVTSEGGTRRIVTSAAFGGKCLDVRGPYEYAGAPVQIRTCDDATGMTWSFEGDGPITSSGGDCVTLAGEARDGAPVRMDPCTGSAAQRWTRHDNGLIESAAGGCLDIQGPRADDGTAVLGCTCGEALDRQHWEVRDIDAS